MIIPSAQIRFAKLAPAVAVLDSESVLDFERRSDNEADTLVYVPGKVEKRTSEPPAKLAPLLRQAGDFYNQFRGRKWSDDDNGAKVMLLMGFRNYLDRQPHIADAAKPFMMKLCGDVLEMRNAEKRLKGIERLGDRFYNYIVNT